MVSLIDSILDWGPLREGHPGDVRWVLGNITINETRVYTLEATLCRAFRKQKCNDVTK